MSLLQLPPIVGKLTARIAAACVGAALAVGGLELWFGDANLVIGLDRIVWIPVMVGAIVGYAFMAYVGKRLERSKKTKAPIFGIPYSRIKRFMDWLNSTDDSGVWTG